MPPQLPPESHYDPKKLDKVFAFIAIALLLSLVGLFAKDYSREWKNYQRQFKALEVEKARVKLDAETIDLSKNDEYQAVLTSIKDAQAKLNAQASSVKAIKRQIYAAEAVLKLHTQQIQFAKAEEGALKYQYEAALHAKASNANTLKNNLDALRAKIENLRLKVEDDTLDVAKRNDALKVQEKEYKDLDKKRMTIAKKKEILEKKLKRIDIAEMSVANQIAEMVRDLPIIDLANPNYKIRQIVVKDIPEDVNFMKVPRVDRCTTCHLGIDNPDFKNAAQPFRSHPNLEMFMDKNSPHPVDQFACTTCHGGRGRATDFIAAAHTPRNDEQKKLWEKKYKWQRLEHWETPMLPAQMTQASCFKCHQDQGTIKGATKLNLGLALIERAGCYGCHTVSKYKEWPKTGPSLEFIASKTSKEWAYRWIEDPKAIRPDTWMPSYFNQSNNSDSASAKRNQQEINAMVHFLFVNSKKLESPAPAIGGEIVKGKELVASLGCMGCHQVNPSKSGEKRNLNSLRQEFGPTLTGLGSKTSEAWLVQWLKDPKRYHGETRMPNMRLSDQEAADIAAYLLQDKTSVVGKPVPSVDEKVLDTIIGDFLRKSESVVDATAKIKGMNRDAKLKFAGQRLIREYGCYSCHKIPGFENEKPIGVELTEEGSKSIERLDFGFTHIEHTKQAWFEQKLLNPRIFDTGRILAPLERNKMPNFNFTADEAEAVTTAIMGFVKDRPNPSKMPNQGTKAAFVNDGQKKIRQFNCQGCHVIEGDGGAVELSITEWLVIHQGKDVAEAKGLLSAFAPPNLINEGAKVQADWLFDFLNSPTIIRPWYKMRMPTYGLRASENNTLVKYFNYLDDEDFPFTDIYHPNPSKEEFIAAEHLMSANAFDCAKCHVFGKQTPKGSQDSWGPDLLLSKRLKPEWIIRWITNPAAIKPGTKMLTLYDPVDFDNAGPPDVLGGDERAQIKALRDYLLSISANPDLLKEQGQGLKDSAATK